MVEAEEITMGGNSYPLTGFGDIEFYVNRRGERTGIGIGLSSEGRTDPPTGRRGQKTDYDPYQRGGRWWEPSDVAELVTELAETLASTDAFVMEGHSVAFRGDASIDQRLTEVTRRRGYPYRLEMLVLFGEGEFEGPDDDGDYGESLEQGLTTELARVQVEAADADAVAQVFASLADDLRAGRVRVGDEELPAGETVRFGLTHVTASNGDYDKIEFGLGFGPVPERGPAGPRYGDEAFNEPTADLAALLQRIAGQILEDGTFELGGETFTTARTANWEIYANPEGFAVEVSHHHALNE
jgi:hypothetical protein